MYNDADAELLQYSESIIDTRAALPRALQHETKVFVADCQTAKLIQPL